MAIYSRPALNTNSDLSPASGPVICLRGMRNRGLWMGLLEIRDCCRPSVPGPLVLGRAEPGHGCWRGGKGAGLWHFPSSWKQRQIPVSSSSNLVPPLECLELEEIPLASGLAQPAAPLSKDLPPSQGQYLPSSPGNLILVQIPSPPHWE